MRRIGSVETSRFFEEMDAITSEIVLGERPKRIPARFLDIDSSDSAERTVRQKKYAKKRSDEYEVASIVNHRLVNNDRTSSLTDNYEFLVVWEGYPLDAATWEPWEHVKLLKIASLYCLHHKLPLEQSGVYDERNIVIV